MCWRRRLNFFTPSTHSCVLTIVPVTFEVAVTSTGELTLDPLVGLQMWTPAEVGAEQDGVALTVIVVVFDTCELSQP